MSKPYKKKVVIGDCVLYHGDCLDIMPTLDKVDAVVTDPPYGIDVIDKTYQNKKTKPGKSAAHKTVWDNSQVWDKERPDLTPLFAWAKCKHIIFGGNYFDLPSTSCWLVWDKQNGSNDFADCELAWTDLDKAVRLIQWQWNGMIRKNQEERFHPTQKPVGVMEWCINHLPEETNIILDPYCGSGTTGVACAKLGRKFIGIEIDEDYFNIAGERIRKAYEQPALFVEPPKQFIQDQLL